MSAWLAALPALLAQSAGAAPRTPDPSTLEALGAVVQRWVDEERIVGAELLVLRGDEPLLHRGYGWRHREERVPMEPGGVFCLRSMTKPVVGAAVQMLIDEGRLTKGEAVARRLPAFDHERARAITVEHLLTHTSGLPLSSLIGRELASFSGERAIADLAGRTGPEHAPGSGFHYSDDGADVLGALVELASGQELEAFLRARLFEPLGLHDVAGVMTRDHPLRARLCSAYAGSPGAWTRFFGPLDPPLFPFLLGSQGLYGTALDYARFLRLYRDGGVARGARLLSARAVADTLRPAQPKGMSTGFAGLASHYGELMTLWIDPAAPPDRRLVAFGHGGSDGTGAWLFPALDLTVLYLTQSRGSRTVIELERELQRHLLDPMLGNEVREPYAHDEAELAALAGEYWIEAERDLCRLAMQAGRTVLEHPGRTPIELAPTSTRDAFTYRAAPDVRLELERDAAGAVVAITIVRNGQGQRRPRLAPGADLPSGPELLARMRSAAGTERLAELGPVRVTGTLEMPALRLAGDLTALADGPQRVRSEVDYGATAECVVLDGARGWRQLPGAAVEELSDAQRADAAVEHPLLTALDWEEHYARVRVLARSEREGRPVWLVRADAAGGRVHDWIVDAVSYLPLALRSSSEIPGVGALGQTTEFEDWRDVGSVRLPFRRSGRFSNRLLGEFETRWEAVEAGVTLAPDAFAAPVEPVAPR